MWTLKPFKIDERDELGSAILTMMKRGARDKNRTLRITSFAALFRLLDALQAERNQYAPTIYKTITFLLVENHHDPETRSFVLKNVQSIFKRVNQIPVGIFVEPLIKQIKISDKGTQAMNTFDYEFFLELTRHPRTNIKLAIMIIDLLA